MQLKILTLSFDRIKGRFDDTQLQEFIKIHSIVSVRDYLFTHNEQPYLTLVITFDPIQEYNPKYQPKAAAQDESWKKILTEADMGMFTLLREWRGKRSKKEGVPPYILATNKELAYIVKNKPQTATDLLKIEGIGEAKVKKYGEDILAITRIDSLNESYKESDS